MAIKFCTDCGKKVEYKFSPPKFCSDCGTPMGVVNTNEASAPQKAFKKIETLNDDETDAEFVPHISKLEYEIENFGSSVQQTMGSLAGRSAPRRKNRTVRDIDNL
jgi:hypothetical protein